MQILGENVMVHNVSFLVMSGWCTQLRYPWKCLPTSLFRGGLKKLTEIDLRYRISSHVALCEYDTFECIFKKDYFSVSMVTRN